MSKRTSAISGLARRLAPDAAGEAMLAFGILAPLLVALSLAILEFSLIIFDYHRAGEATRRGARLAAISDPVPQVAGFAAGTVIQCTSSAGGVTCGAAATGSASVFDAVLAEMRILLPSVTPENVEITYRDAGIGDPATPGGIITLVTVRLVNLAQPFYALSAIPGMPSGFTYPPFTTSLLAAGLGPTSP